MRLDEFWKCVLSKKNRFSRSIEGIKIMLKKHNTFIISILCLFFSININAQSINIPTETAAPEAAAPFVKTELSTVELQAFQDRAPQKLQDVADHLYLLSSPLEEQIKYVARTTLENDFFSTDVAIIYYDIAKKEKKNTPLSTFLHDVETAKTPIIIKVHDCKNKSNLVPIGGNYQWTVACKWQWSQGDETVYTEMLFEAFLVQKEKQFGSRTLLVWEVLLGDVLELRIL